MNDQKEPERKPIPRLDYDDIAAYPPLSAADVTDIIAKREYETQGRHAQPKVRQARDKAQYVRQQKGHSWILHWIVLGVFTLWIVPIYYSFSPNHYWHL